MSNNRRRNNKKDETRSRQLAAAAEPRLREPYYTANRLTMQSVYDAAVSQRQAEELQEEWNAQTLTV